MTVEFAFRSGGWAAAIAKPVVALAFLASIWVPLAAEPLPVPSASASAGSSLRPEDHRVATVAYRLARAGAAECPEPYPLTGLLLHHLAEYHPPDQADLIRQFGLDRGPGILSVVDGSPAAAAGLRAGDVLLQVNGLSFPSPTEIAAEEDQDDRRARIEDSEAVLERELRKGPVALSVLRAGDILPIRLAPVEGCPMRVRLARSTQHNAFADGRYVTMTTAMLDFIESDDELAVVLAHELAHNVLHHARELRENGVPRGFLRELGIGAGQVYQTEEEADRLAVKLVRAAGFDTGAAVPFWRRFLTRFDGPQIIRTHPSLSARIAIWGEGSSPAPDPDASE